MSAAVIPRQIEYANLRAKNQLTLPDRLASQLGVKPGDRFLVFLQSPDEVVFRRSGANLAGRYPGLWGDTDEEIAAHLRALRDEWEHGRE
jgi:bifunctional DNA-binding transcriptional regulator/antitoxin component of YhaV-PrlF toxin-antitoxin module